MNKVVMKKLIDKTTLVAEIEKRLHANGAFDEVGDEAWAEDVGMCNAYKSILSFLNTLEVKEVDLKRAIDKWIDDTAITHEDCSVADVISTAKHFFELGLKTRKGE